MVEQVERAARALRVVRTASATFQTEDTRLVRRIETRLHWNARLRLLLWSGAATSMLGAVAMFVLRWDPLAGEGSVLMLAWILFFLGIGSAAVAVTERRRMTPLEVAQERLTTAYERFLNAREVLERAANQLEDAIGAYADRSMDGTDG